MARAETDKVRRAEGARYTPSSAWELFPGPAVEALKYQHIVREVFTALQYCLSPAGVCEIYITKCAALRGVFPIHFHPSPPPTPPANCHVRMSESRPTSFTGKFEFTTSP